ncbi:MAG: hypothetical protein RL528_717 [Bacteroidota bacterium]|jgi:hypothetical protein
MRELLLGLILFSITLNAKAQNWTLINSNTTNDIIDITFYDDSVGFFLTNTGKLFHSQDKGINWILVHQDTSLISGQIAVTNDSIFWYASDINGTPVKSKSSLSSFIFTKDTVDILPIRPVFWQNEIWDVNKVNQLIAPEFVQEFSVSDNYIWATSESKIFKSDDLGITWQQCHFFTGLSSGPYQSYYNGTNNMIAITQYPTNIHSTTDGINWNFSAPLNGLYFYFVNSNNFLAYNFSLHTPKIYKTNDGGQSFTSENLVDIPTGLYSKNNNNESIFIYGKNGMLYKSTNGGGLMSTEYMEMEKIQIYPNPTSDFITIKTDHKIDSYSIFDITGKKIMQTAEKTIDLRTYTNGIYLLTFEFEGKTQTKKIILN